MNHLQVFINVKIKNLGFLTDLANFFLSPARFIFEGKTVLIEEDAKTCKPVENGNIAKVSSFYSDRNAPLSHSKASKQLDKLKSTRWGLTPFSALITPILPAICLLPFTLIGSILKAFTYLLPSVREAHRTVKDRLTAVDLILDLDQAADNDALQGSLDEHLRTGQKINALTIQQKQDLSHQNTHKDTLERIRKINPKMIILTGANWRKNNFDFKTTLVGEPNSGIKDKTKKWDLSALEDDSSTKIVNSVDKALSQSSSGFFAPKYKHSLYVVMERVEQEATVLRQSQA